MTQIEESRICVKNLTKNCDEKFLRTFFSSIGAKITDCRLLKNDEGISRRIAFIGFARPEDAKRALDELDGAKVGVNKIKVELAKDFRGNTGSKKARKEKKLTFTIQGWKIFLGHYPLFFFNRDSFLFSESHSSAPAFFTRENVEKRTEAVFGARIVEKKHQTICLDAKKTGC